MRVKNSNRGGQMKNAISEALEVLVILTENGVDIRKIPIKKTDKDGKQKYIVLKDIKQYGIDIDKIISENNLAPDFPIGSRIHKIRDTYNAIERGKKTQYKLTKEQKLEIEIMGIIKKKNVISEAIEILNILSANGVNLVNIELSNRTKDGNRIYVRLKDVSQDRVKIEGIMKKYKLDPDYPIGYMITRLTTIYNKIKDEKEYVYMITKEQQRQLESLIGNGEMSSELINAKKERDSAKDENNRARKLEDEVTIKFDNMPITGLANKVEWRDYGIIS